MTRDDGPRVTYVRYPWPPLDAAVGGCIDCRFELFEVTRRSDDAHGRAPKVWVDSSGSRVCQKGKRKGKAHMLNAASYKGVPLQLGFSRRRTSRR